MTCYDDDQSSASPSTDHPARGCELRRNNRLQRLFFDAQREFYLKEEAIVGDFEHGLREGLSTFSESPTGGPTLGADTLSLVEVDT